MCYCFPYVGKDPNRYPIVFYCKVKDKNDLEEWLKCLEKNENGGSTNKEKSGCSSFGSSSLDWRNKREKSRCIRKDNEEIGKSFSDVIGNDDNSSPQLSPIDIASFETVSKYYAPLQWSREIPKGVKTTLICIPQPKSKNSKMDLEEDNFYTMKILLNNPEEYSLLSGGPLSGSYRLNEVNFCWGFDDDNGSQHSFCGKRYAVEMQVMYDLENGEEDAAKKLALCYLFQTTDENLNCPMECIAESVQEWFRSEDEEEVIIPNFVLRRLICKETSNYYTYIGSETRAPFEKPVQFVIFRTLQCVNRCQMEIFREYITRCNRANISSNPKPVVFRARNQSEMNSCKRYKSQSALKF